MGDLLKEAIADAKAVRETALQNAKMALEEAFTPQLKSMLSAKLKEDEHEDEAEEGSYEETEYEEGEHEEVPAEEGSYAEDEEVPAEEGSYEEAEHEDEAEEIPAEEGEHEGEDEGEDSLDLEAVIRELEAELSEGEDDEDETVDEQDEAYEETADKVEGGEPMGEGEEKEDDEDVEIDEALFTEEEDDEDKDEVDEQSDSSKIGTGDNKVDYADAGDEEDPQGAKIVKAKMESVTSELKEYKEAVKFLKNKLHEVNILNAKLLFTNKLFKSYSLNNNQKLKVVETFDRAQTTREIKLVYSTLAEQFGDNGAIIRKKSIKESASSAVSSTKPSKESKKVITEETQVANRFKKLAGLI